MSTPIPKISAPAGRAFAAEHITSLEQLANYTEKQIADLHGVGPKVMRILKETMRKHGINFKAR